MFYRVKVKDHIRVTPELFGKDIHEAITTQVREQYTGYISKEIGMVVDVAQVHDVNDGVMIPGDGAVFYECVFDLIAFEPEMQEVLPCRVKDIAEFGVFVDVGPLDGMVHISQAMNDYVSFTKDHVLQGKESNRVLKVGEHCQARIVAISYKDITNPKLGLTMRQQGLGKAEWIAEDLGEAPAEAKAKKK